MGRDAALFLKNVWGYMRSEVAEGTQELGHNMEGWGNCIRVKIEPIDSGARRGVVFEECLGIYA